MLKKKKTVHGLMFYLFQNIQLFIPKVDGFYTYAANKILLIKDDGV